MLFFQNSVPGTMAKRTALLLMSLPFFSVLTRRTSAFNVAQTMSMASSSRTSTGSGTTGIPLPPVSSRIRTTLDPCVVLMKELIGKYADRWADRGGIYSLAQGVVYWKPPPQCQAKLEQALSQQHADGDDNSHTLHLYGPDEGLPELRELLLQKLAAENGLSNHDVMVTVGANQAYMNCVLALLSSETEDRAIVFRPYYFNHYMALQMTIGEDQIITGPTSDAGAPDLDWLQEQLENQDLNSDLRRIRLVTITNPCNPTGCAQSREFVQRAVQLCRMHHAWLVLDATYEYFVQPQQRGENDEDVNGSHTTTIAPAFDEPHCLHIFSLSKAYALAGYRCGYVAVHRDASDLWRQLLKVQDTIPIAPSRVAQVAAMGALEAGRFWVQDRIATLEEGRAALRKVLEDHLPTVVGGDGAIYLWAKLPRSDSGDENESMNDVQVAERLVRDFGVALIPGSFCGVPGWIRICYANLPPEKSVEAAQRLARGLRQIVGNSRIGIMSADVS